MINKKYYCSIRDKYISNKNSHNKTKLHTQFSLSVVNKYYIDNIPVSEIDNIINNHIYEYKKKFHEFDCWCRIQNDYLCEKIDLRWISGTDVKVQEEIKTRHNCNQNDVVCMEIWFVTDIVNASYSHYFQLPKPMIERNICHVIDRNPNLIKTLNRMPHPYARHIIFKHWGVSFDNHVGIIRESLPVNWMENEPNIIT